MAPRLEQNQLALDNGLREEARLLTIFHNYDDDTETEHFIHHKSKQDLVLSAALGCHFCSLAANTSWNPHIELGRFSVNGDNIGNTGRYQSQEVGPSINVGSGGFAEGNHTRGNQTTENQSPVTTLLDPTPPDVLEQVAFLITPLDNDYEGTPVSGSGFYFLRDGQWEDLSHEESGDEESGQDTESNEDGSALSIGEFRRQKSGIWCDITRAASSNEQPTLKLSFKEYSGPSGHQVSRDFHFIRPGSTARISRDSSEPSSSTNSQSTFNLAKEWLDECIQTHSKCRSRTFDKGSLPSRLLDVGRSLDELTIRVQNTNELGVSYQYLALSHCWGSSRTAKLTSTSCRQYYVSILVQDLPKTYQDAVCVTKQLGFRYLWIDSLCIIQDSGEDWKRESGKMGDIYRNSTCCIAALAAADGGVGCFFPRNPMAHFPCKLGVSGHDDIFIAVETDARHYDYANGSFDGIRNPLWTRAWVFQETALAPRTLNYCADMIYWECLCVRAWENLPDWRMMAHSESVKSRIGEIKMLGERANAEPDSGFALSIRVEWGKIVNAYCRGNLTRETDKLIALSGLASRVQLYTGWNYLAGLWEPNILQQLLWYNVARYPNGRGRGRERLSGKRPLEYCAPTWSWASINGDISWYHPKVKYEWLATVINVQVDLADPEYPFSQVSGGTLRLRGPVQTAYALREDNTRGSNNSRMAGTEFRLPPGGNLTIYQDTTCPCQVPCGVCEGGMAFFTLGECEKAANPGPPRTRYVHARVGLVISPVKVQDGFYRRIGWFLEYLSEQESSFYQPSDVQEITVV